MRIRFLFALFVLLSGSLNAQRTSTWVQKFPTLSPVARVYSCSAQDPMRGNILLFGGWQVGVAYLNDTWMWDGFQWTQLSPSQSPSPRFAASMTYDVRRNAVVLFGGFGSDGPLNDIWSWNGTTWAQQFPTSSPPVRYASHIAYDAARQQVVVFGGYTSGATITEQILGDTWVWDGQSWTQKTPSVVPPKRAYGTLTYDSAHRNVVLFGGVGLNDAGEQVYLNDTWVWDGATWTQMFPSVIPPENAGMIMAYYAGRREVLMFGGWADSSTWTWDGRNWTKELPSVAPSSRWVAPIASDSRNVVLFGGGIYVSGIDTGLVDTWVWTRREK